MERPAPDLLARPAVCGHPTGMILTRAHRSSDLLRKRALPGGYFARAIYAGGQNHAGPANLLSGASRLSGLCASLRPSARRGAAYGLGFVFMHDGVFKQRVQPLDFLNRFVSLWHRHNVSANLCVNQRGFFAAAQLIT